MAGVDGDSFMKEFKDLEAFYTSGIKDKVLTDLEAATTSTHNLVKTLNLWTSNSYCLNADASDTLVTELVQAIYMVSEIGLIQHVIAVGSEAQTIALWALIESLCVQAPPAPVPTSQP
jgi:hypothetical protein